eukprot:CAMPEP_0202968794 /NCGR_PEP_ID=MMETSP1396-20130829/14243_1 /ASSEMBLY_ACC=CAM_ASM_000872 /TAXON_ID= /ORGANISM="Pseudokeronopsis sp., Strain Brazil" /LENGTH=72 /DNA_ID=CAMNT_0049695527 /DNA_START=55 /DNA_END=273 /DNA_ORIENTATION=+
MICFYEFLGTAMLLLGYNFNGGIAVAFALFVGIIMAGKISGAMFNPAVSIAVFVSSGRIKTEFILFLMVVAS